MPSVYMPSTQVIHVVELVQLMQFVGQSDISEFILNIIDNIVTYIIHFYHILLPIVMETPLLLVYYLIYLCPHIYIVMAHDIGYYLVRTMAYVLT